VDQTRFFLTSEVNFGNDGDFSDEAMIRKVNTNLANELGNLVQRTLTLVFKNCGKAVPSVVGPFTQKDEALLAKAKALREKAATAVSSQAIHRYSQVMVQMVTDANKYIDDQEPWVLRKTDLDRMGTVLYVLMEVLRYVAILYQPIMPESSNKILDILTVPKEERTFAHLDSCAIKLGAQVSKPEAVFPRLELPELVDA
jgi:methionyl-tRNA synthetase